MISDVRQKTEELAFLINHKNKTLMELSANFNKRNDEKFNKYFRI